MSVKKHPNPNEGDIAILTESSEESTYIQVTEHTQVVIETKEQGTVRNSGGTDCSEVCIYVRRPLGEYQDVYRLWLNDEVLRPESFKKKLLKHDLKVVNFESRKPQQKYWKEGTL